jgi:hypothetical protein
MRGFIKDYRQEIESDIWMMPPLYHRVWQWIKYKVNHEDAEIPARDGTKFHIKKGQHLTSVRSIAEGVKWYEGLKEKVPNPKTINAILAWLVKQDMIQIDKGKGNRQYTLITVVNWESYQSKDDKGNSKETVGGEARKQLVDINKNDKECIKNDKEVKKTSRHVFNESQMKLAKILWKYVQQNDPSMKQPNLDNWANTIRLMMERDNREGKEIQEVILWATKDSFWCKNILSADKLRKQFSTLKIQMQKENDKEVKIVGTNQPYFETPERYDFSKRRAW